MLQGIGNIENNNLPPIISNINSVNDSTGYILTRDSNNNVVVEEAPPPIISNIDSVNESTNYVITRDSNSNVVVEELSETIQNLNAVADNQRYHITRRVGNVLAILDRSIQIPTPNDIADLVYAIRVNNNNYTLTRTPALTDYVFETDDLQFFATFNVLGSRSSRSVHVCNTSGKLIKLGLLHVDLSINEGLINRQYRFNLIQNDNTRQLISIDPNNSVGNSRSRSLDIEDFNIFVLSGDTLGIMYQRDGGANLGNYCQVRITVDTNARQNNFGENQIP